MSTAKKLGIPTTAVLMLASLAFAAPAFAQDSTATPPAATEPATTDPTAAPAEGAAPEIDPATGLPIEPAAPDATTAPIAEAAPTEPVENPYGPTALFKHGDWVTWTVGIVLAVMSVGSWLIFLTKWLSSGRLLGQAKSVSRLWSAGSLEEGLSRLDKRSVFRSLAEDAQAAADQHSQVSSQVGLSDWVGNALNRSIDNVSAQLRGGNAFLATVASSAPFVGLMGTVYGILKALLAIGISGQPSIDKVAGPVGEALIMTFIGLFAAVPAVIFYNVIVGRNRAVVDAMRNFAGDVQGAVLGAAPVSGKRR